MTILIILWTIFFLVVPAAIILLCKKVKFFGQIGEILLLYIFGIIFANLLIFPFPDLALNLKMVQDGLTSITIPIAIPLILFSCNYKKLPLRSATLSLIFGLLAICSAVIIGYFIFRGPSKIQNINEVAAMLVGVYTGGTPNLAALKMMLGVNETTYILINSFDMMVSFIFLMFLLSFGTKFIRKILPYKMKTKTLAHVRTTKTLENSANQDELKGLKSQEKLPNSPDETYEHIFTNGNFRSSISAIMTAILIVGLSIGISFLIKNAISMVIIMLSLTSFAIAASFITYIQKAKKTYDIGMYLVLIFSVVVASMVNIREINFSAGLWLLAYIAFAIFGSLIIQIILARIFKIDADSTIITSVALVNSPLFVPLIADAMKNRQAVIIGVTVGIIGYAAGNYLGFIIAAVLR
ncbi:MAG: DUF819 family protein [Bacteroidales bacterium]